MTRTGRTLALAAAIALAGGSANAAPKPAFVKDAGLGKAEAALLVKARAACGGDAWDQVRGWHEAGRVDLPGQPGLRYDAYHDIATLKTTYVQRLNGKLVRLGGYDGSATWRVGPDGAIQRFTDEALLRRARRDMYVSNAGYFFPKRYPARFESLGPRTLGGRAFDALRITPANAESVEIWFDRATGHIGRIVAGTEWAEGSDYRSFGAVCAPLRLRQGDTKDPAHVLVLHVESVDTGPIDPSRFVPTTVAAQ